MSAKEDINSQNSNYYGSSFFREFPVPSFEEWRTVIGKSLKGAPFEERLFTLTDEGITLRPIYRQQDIEDLPFISSLPGQFPFVRGVAKADVASHAWEISQKIEEITPKEFNKAARWDLERGQTTLYVVLDRPGHLGLDPVEVEKEKIGQDGVSIFCVKDMSQALEGIHLERVPIRVEAGAMAIPALSFVIAHMRNQGERISELRGCIGLDPLGMLVQEGTLPYSLDAAYDMMAKSSQWAEANAPKLQTILISTQPYHDGGGNAVQELAFALATGVEYIRALLERGLAIEEIAPKISFSFSIGSNFFMEIAKFRAARMLYAQIVSAFGGNEETMKMSIHALTSAWTKTKFDPYVNMLRSTTEAFAGILGGVNSLHVSPFDEAVRPADEFSRRIARNTQLILAKEAHLARVQDPAGGSWYIEWLTDAVAQKAWQLFQEIEAQKGMYQALQSGFVQGKIADMAKQRAKRVNQRAERIVGVNIYSNLREHPLSDEQTGQVLLQRQRWTEFREYRLAVDSDRKNSALDELADAGSIRSKPWLEFVVAAAETGATLGEIKKVLCLEEKFPPEVAAIPRHRKAEGFETLRENAERFKKRTGLLPKVFVLNVGSVVQHKARADFVTSFFAVGGFEAVMNQVEDSIEAAVREALQSEASVVVVCGKDEVYPESVPQIARLVKATKPGATVYVAGRLSPTQMEEYQQAGVDDSLHATTDCYELLFNLQMQKGIGR